VNHRDGDEGVVAFGGAFVVVTAKADAAAPAEDYPPAQLTASAVINERDVVKDPIALGTVKLAAAPKLLVRVLRKDQSEEASDATSQTVSGDDGTPVELEIAPGETMSALVRIKRNGFDGEVALGGDYAGRDLPHGVFVDNIGLNGLTLLAGDNEREFFITAAKWVPEQSRRFHLRAEVEGNQTSWPIWLHVRRTNVSSEPIEPIESTAAQ
jgi:hypothetical protein